MCGIAGICARDCTIDVECLTKMAEVLRHRGPDDGGVWVSTDRKTGLAHRRFAIIDLSSHGHQPMGDRSGRYWITFNGEIYNFQALRDELISLGQNFRTASDTEVILEAYRAWGENCLSRLNGMFAFALVDTLKQEVLLARDRVGKKPVY